MPTSLLTTKLFAPSTRLEFVSRQHLVEQLNEGLHRKLTLISAPAGFGKTTLLSEWVDNLKIDTIKEKLESLELAQNKSNQRMIQIVQKMHEMYEGTSLLEVIKRSFRHYPKQSTSQYEA